MNTKNSFLILLMMSAFLSSAKEKTIGIESAHSNVQDYANQSFKNDIVTIMKEIEFACDSTNTDPDHVDFLIDARIDACNNRNTCYTIRIIVTDAKSGRIKENFDKPIAKEYYHREMLDVVRRAIHEMDFFQVEEEWDSYFMPGVAFDFYQPRGDVGIYYGPSAEAVFYSRSKTRQSDSGGPSRIKVYGKAGILLSEYSDSSDVFLLSTGLNLSFESSTDRNYLLPYFGLEFGGLIFSDFSSFQFTPLVGVQLISTPKIIWSAQAGYIYSIKQFDQISGYNFKTSVNVLLWGKKKERTFY